MSGVLDRIGVYLFPWGKTPPTLDSLVTLAELCEEMGFDSVQMPWHYTLPKVRVFTAFGNRCVIDPLVALPVIASRTRRVRISLNSVVLPLFHPFTWAKWFATMDHVSGGRFIPGVAVGWWEEDFKAGGALPAGRGARMDEAMRMLSDLFEGREITSPGKFYDARGLALDPRPIQHPMPMWVGGGIKSIERAVRWGSGLCPINPSAAEIRRDYRPALDEAGRRYQKRPDLACFNYILVVDDPNRLETYFRPRMLARINEVSLDEILNAPPDKQWLQPEDRVIWGSPRECADRLSELFAAGADYFVIDFYFHGLEDEEFGKQQMKRFVEDVVPLIRT